jgi:hypothetical protein
VWYLVEGERREEVLEKSGIFVLLQHITTDKGNSSLINYKLLFRRHWLGCDVSRQKALMEFGRFPLRTPTEGIEPSTTRLRVVRSTD